MHVRVACCCNFLGDDSDDDSDEDNDDDTDDDDDDDDSDENNGIHSFDELISGFMSGKMASPIGWIHTRHLMHGYFFVFI